MTYISPGAEDLTLYHYDGCAFCTHVRIAMGELGLVLKEKNVLADPEARRELIDVRGRGTVPVLRIEAEDGEVTWMGESQDIIAYLFERFGEGKKPSAASRGQLETFTKFGMWGLLLAGAVFTEARGVLWTAACALAAGRSLYLWHRTRAWYHAAIGGVFILATFSVAAEALSLFIVEWWYAAFALVLVLLVLSVFRRKRV